jgi:hypothetical protein
MLFGWLSERIGRKPVIPASFLLAAATYCPLHAALGWGGGAVPFITTRGLGGHAQSWMDARLFDRAACGRAVALAFPDAGNATDEDLGSSYRAGLSRPALTQNQLSGSPTLPTPRIIAG